MQTIENTDPPFLSNFGFMITYKCTVACPHCIVKAGPHRTEEMTLDDAVSWLDQIASFKKDKDFPIGISLTGGEPFYNESLLKGISEHAQQLGFMVSVVTNAFWADTPDNAIEVLSDYDAIQLISISTDEYHQYNIPYRYIRNAVIACKKLNKIYNVAVATESESDVKYIELFDKLLEITEREKIETSFTVPVGRGKSKLRNGKFDLVEDPSKSACYMASFPVIFPNGRVIACIGPPITIKECNPLELGNLKKDTLIEIIQKAEINPTLHALRTFGPISLVELLRMNGYEDIIPAEFIKDCPCDVCNKLFSDIATAQVISDLAREPEFFNKVAYGRYYYMKETAMLELV